MHLSASANPIIFSVSGLPMKQAKKFPVTVLSAFREAGKIPLLARSAWWRVLLVLPLCLLLWLGVYWALTGEV